MMGEYFRYDNPFERKYNEVTQTSTLHCCHKPTRRRSLACLMSSSPVLLKAVSQGSHSLANIDCVLAPEIDYNIDEARLTIETRDVKGIRCQGGGR